MAERGGKPQEKPIARKVNESFPLMRERADAMEYPAYQGQYEKMLDIVAVQDKTLLEKENNVEFLRSLLPHGQETFGFANLETR